LVFDESVRVDVYFFEHNSEHPFSLVGIPRFQVFVVAKKNLFVEVFVQVAILFQSDGVDVVRR
jgi:hypothetical protein